MKLLITTFLLTFSTCYAGSIRGNIKDKDFAKLPGRDRLNDNFQPKLQDLCTSGKTFQLGDDCEVSFALEDLEPTSGEHVFKSHACGDEDTIIVTMDLDEKMPSRAARLNQRSMEWTELVPMPHLEKQGCMYTTIADIDVDPKKVKKRRFHGDERRANGGRRNLNSTSTFDTGAAPVGHVGRELQTTCSEYKVIRLAVRYDSRFCDELGNGTPEGAVAYVNTIIEMMNPFFNVAPLCMKVEPCSIEGSCSANTDPYRSMLDNFNTVCEEGDNNDLLDNFRAIFPSPPQGCDNTHLFFGGDPKPDDAAGCAYIAALCDNWSVGVNSISGNFPMIDHILLASHELGHSLAAEHVLGEDQYIMSYGSQPDSFKQENVDRMVNFVSQSHAQDSTCTAIEIPGPPTVGPISTPTVAPTSAPCTGSEFRLVLQTDQYGDEITWDVTGANENTVAQGNGYSSSTRYEINGCLPSGTFYTFTIRDSYGDGICCGYGAGSYQIYIDGSLVHWSNGQYGREEVVSLSGGNNSSPPTPGPTPNPTVAPTPNPTPGPTLNPTLPPIPNPTAAPIPNPTPAPVPTPTSPPVNSPTGVCSGHEFRLELQSDQWGEEVSFEVSDPNGNVVVQGGNYPLGYISIAISECLQSDGVHTFKIMDSYGDGMIGDAYYKLWYDGHLVIYHDGNYGYGETVTVPDGAVHAL